MHETRFDVRWLPTLAVMLQADFYWGKIDHHRHDDKRVDYEIRRDGEPDFGRYSPSIESFAWSLVDLRWPKRLKDHPTLQVPAASVADKSANEESSSARSLGDSTPQPPVGIRVDGSGSEQAASQRPSHMGKPLVPGLRCRDPALLVRDLEEGGATRARARWTLVAAELERLAPDARTTTFLTLSASTAVGSAL